MLEFKNVAYGWSGRNILQTGLELSFAGAQVYVILGPNGCGKSTFFNLLQNRGVFHTGEIILDQKNLRQYSQNELARKMIVVGQSCDQNISMKVIDFVITGFYPYLNVFQAPSREHLKQAQDILSFLEIGQWAQRSVSTLSGGEFKQVLLARCLTGERGIILLDEIDLALDFANQIKLIRIIRKLRDSGKCIVLISHNPNIALSLKSSVLLLGRGRPVLFGTAESVVTRENLQSYFGINVIETCSSEHNLVQFVPV